MENERDLLAIEEEDEAEKNQLDNQLQISRGPGMNNALPLTHTETPDERFMAMS
jgi:hypothetical protein